MATQTYQISLCDSVRIIDRSLQSRQFRQTQNLSNLSTE